MNLIHR